MLNKHLGEGDDILLLNRRNQLCIRVDYYLHYLRNTYYRLKRFKTSSNTYVMFTFDVEEDWAEAPYRYYSSYKYVDSGVFHSLVNGLSERGVSATFYTTPNVARDRPEVLKYLEREGQTVGLHLHPHNLMHNIRYPYYSGEEDRITLYSFTSKMELMKKAKKTVESVLGHEVLLYRSGKLACDYQVERAAKLTGFKAISNHYGIFFIKPFSLWNLGTSTFELFSNQHADVDKYIELFEKTKNYDSFLVFGAHPMLLYNHRKKCVKKNVLNMFLKFLTFLQCNSKVKIIEQHEFLSYLHTIM